jgi:hypothetical protein
VDIALILSCGLVAAVLITASLPAELTWLQRLIIFLVAFDVASGMLSNFTRSTASWYSSQPGWMHYAFLMAHVVHPLLLLWAAGGQALPWLAGLYLFTLVSGIMTLAARGLPYRNLLALFLVVDGTVLFLQVFPPPVAYLFWFPPLFLFKLIAGFANKTKNVGLVR